MEIFRCGSLVLLGAYSFQRLVTRYGNVKQFLRYQKKHVQSRSFGDSQKTSSASDNGAKLEVSTSEVTVRTSSSMQPLTFCFLWLRDHCRCSKCYNHNTNQRAVDLLSIPGDVKPKSCLIRNGHLSIVWNDNHKSSFPLEWLRDNSYHGALSARRKKITTWHGAEAPHLDIAHVHREKYLTQSGLCELVSSLVTYGVGFVESVPASVEATQQVVEQLAHVHRTFFGDMWEFSDKMDHSDTAYTKQYLGVHTDNTYLSEAAGLQVFHCLHHDGEGGETLLVDGFRAAECLKVANPAGYDILSSTPIESEYIENGKHYICMEPVLKHCLLTGEINQIRFNLYDRAPFRMVPLHHTPKYYEALRNFAAEIRSPEAEWKVKLRPGSVVFIDNWRVLHGREAYTGCRRMAGCYVGRADFLSRARVLGLI